MSENAKINRFTSSQDDAFGLPVEQLPQHVIHRWAVLGDLRDRIGLCRRRRRRCGSVRGGGRWWRNIAALAAPTLARSTQALLQQIAQSLAELAAERIGRSGGAATAGAASAQQSAKT